MLFSHLLNIYLLFNSDHASQGKEADGFHFNLFPRFPSLNYQAVFVLKRKKIRITWHIPRFLLAHISFSQVNYPGRETDIRQSSVTKVVCKQAIKKQPQQLSSSDWNTNFWYVFKALYIHVKMRKQKKMELSTNVPETNDISI